jgi:hypothetical protein
MAILMVFHCRLSIILNMRIITIIIFILSVSAQGAELSTKALADLAKLCRANQGCTYSLTQAKELTGSNAYVLSTFKNYEEKSPTLGPKVIQKYIHKHAKELRDSKYALGIWLDQNIFYLDVVTVLPKTNTLTENDVLACAVKFNQLAVYDLQKRAVINTKDHPQSGHCPLQ